MWNKSSKLEWEILEDESREDPWPPKSSLEVDQSGPSGRHEMRRLVVFAMTMVALLMAGVGAAYARNEAQNGIAEVE